MRTLRRCLLAASSGVALLSAASARTAEAPLSVGVAVEVSRDEPAFRHVESVLAADPRDGRNLIAACMTFGAAPGVAVYASKDAGRTWTRATREGGATSFDGIDPALAFAPDGTAHLATLGSELASWTSTDGGRTWGGRAAVPGSSWDRPWIGADGQGRVVAAGKLPVTVFGHVADDLVGVSVSKDGGRTFAFPRLLLPPPERDALNIVSDLLVAAEGRIVLALQTFVPATVRHTLLSGAYSTIVSTDGGRTFAPPRLAAPFRVFGHAREGKSLFALGGARLAADGSQGRHRGRLHLAWLDVVEGDARVMTAFSDDGGGRWSPPVRVSDGATAIDESTPAVAVNDEGTVAVSWYDRRGDPSGACYQPYVAASTDGGATFSANVRLEARPVCPIAEGSGTDPVQSEYRFKNGGDTHGIVGLPGGRFLVAWIGKGERELQLRATEVAVAGSRAR
jgi:hypothetical protein